MITLNPKWMDDFATEDSRYNIYFKFVFTVFIVSLLGIIVHNKISETLGDFISFANFIFSAYIALCIINKAGVIKIIIRLVVGLLASMFIGLVLTGLIGPWGAVIMIIAASIVNRKRLAFVKKYQRYIWIYVIIWIISAIILAFISYGLLQYATSAKEMASIGVLAKSILFTVILPIIGTIATLIFIRREQKLGTPFLVCQRLFFTVPMTFFFYITAVFAMLHFFDFSHGDSADISGDNMGLMGDPLNDPTLLAPAGFHGEGLTNSGLSMTNVNTDISGHAADISMQHQGTEFVDSSTTNNDIQKISNQSIQDNPAIQVAQELSDKANAHSVQNEPAMQVAQESPDNILAANKSEHISQDFKITDAGDTNTVVEVKDDKIFDSSNNQIGTVNKDPYGNVEIRDDKGMTVASTDGQFVYDSSSKPVDNTISERSGDLIDDKTGKTVGHVKQS